MVPLVSVALVTYNHAPFIKRAVDSVLGQDYPNVEIIAADDSSNDGTWEILQEYRKRNPDRIRVLSSERNRGVDGIVPNYNRALKECKGEYICFLEGDDYYLPGKLSRQVNWFEADDRRVLCGHDIEVFDSGSGKILHLWSERFGLPSGTGASRVIRNNVPFGTVSIMVRASEIPESGWDSRLRIVCDWMMWINILAQGGEFGFIPGVHARYRKHGNNITGSHSDIINEDQFVTMALIEARHAHLFTACRAGRARLHYRNAITAIQSGNIQKARAHFVNCFHVGSAFRLKSACGALITLLPPKVAWRCFARLNPRLRPAQGSEQIQSVK
jgi:cellulose synthase/poly-beta-1,6-N-acetylglucosamine synthase-like glycosyltransferase